METNLNINGFIFDDISLIQLTTMFTDRIVLTNFIHFSLILV